jgi:hypothetical protein
LYYYHNETNNGENKMRIKPTYLSTEEDIVIIINGRLTTIKDRRQFNKGALAAIQRKIPNRGRRSIDQQIDWLAGYRRVSDWRAITS